MNLFEKYIQVISFNPVIANKIIIRADIELGLKKQYLLLFCVYVNY